MITLVLGGVRSGKSEVAEGLMGRGPVTYVATAPPPARRDGADDGDDADDAEFAARIDRHRARRPELWRTVEESRDLAGVIGCAGPVLVDSLGTWVAASMFPEGSPDVDALIVALLARDGDTVLVSEEVGLGVHPPTEVGRRFADLLGEVNRRVAAVADRCLLVVAGRWVELPPGDHGPPVGAVEPPGVGPPGVGPPGVGPPGVGPPGAAETHTPEVRPGRGHGFRSALSFLTPMGGAVAPSPLTLSWFPPVGAVLGLALGLVWAAADGTFGPWAGAAVVVVADLVLTGALHFDGLVDSADGLFPHLPRERRLAVMAEPTTGAFGVAAGAGSLLLRAAALATFAAERDPSPLLLGALWCLSRTSMAVAAGLVPYARPGGLVAAFAQPGPAPTRRWLGAAGLALACALAAADDVVLLAAVGSAAAGAVAFHALARRRIGGYTGDTLGAGGFLAETVGLLAAVAVL